MKDLSKLLGGGDAAPAKLSPQEVQAKMDVIKELMQEMVEAMGGQVKSGMDDMGALKKVTVAAPDDQSLSKGLDLAKDVAVGDDAEEGSESPEEKLAEVKDPSVELKEDAVSLDKPAHPMAHFMQDDGQDLYSLMQKKKKKQLG